MSRPDLLRLSDAVLEDLTNRGTLRRARKELGAAALTVTEADDGTVTVSADDGTTCVLYANRPFAEWTCSCLAANNCRHIVRAILHYQTACSEPQAVEEKKPDSTDLPGPEPPGVAALGKVEPEAVFNPASITREHLRAALSPAALRRADQLAGQGLLAHVGSIRGISVVRIHHPTPVSVRFLAGADLNYVRCTCHDPDPCLHVAVAVAAAAGRRFGDTGLVSVAGDEWRPDASLLSEIRGAVGELVRVGAESGHRNLRGVWRRLAVRAREAELHHVADVLDELLDELARYEARSQEFTPSRLVGLSAELLARAMSLGNPEPERIPDRLVAGSPAQQTRVSKARLIGLGTELVELDDECRLIAHLVDARSGAPMRVTKRIIDKERRPSSQLAGGLVSGITIGNWGGGQVMSLGGRMFGHGDFSHTNRSAVGFPAGAMDQLEAPFRVETIAELATQQTRLPAVLDDRSAGTDLAACRVTGVGNIHFDPGISSLVADLRDADGQSFQLALRHTARRDGSVRATLVRLLSWEKDLPKEAFVSGRWRWGARRVVVDPLLLVGDGVPLQPHVAEPVATDVHWRTGAGDAPLTSPGALLRGLDSLLGELLLAGADRIHLRDQDWREFVRQARRAGSQLIADHAQAFLDHRDPARVEKLLLISAFGGPLA